MAYDASPSILTQASHQWASRPSDERFTSLTDLFSATRAIRQNSSDRVVANRDLSFAPVANDSKGLVITGPNGQPAAVTHHAFNQLASLSGAPAGYLRTLPSDMAADCLNFGLKVSRDVESVGVLLTKGDGLTSVRAATGPNYGRVWNSDVAGALVNRFGDGVTGDFRVPGIFGKALAEVTKDNTTLYAGDRDMFVFLADEENRIVVPNRRNGESGTMARGFFVWNSEVGAGTLGVATFLFDYVCQNRIVWGAAEYKEIKVRHTSGAPHRFVEEVAPALQRYAESSTASIDRTLADARSKRIDDVSEFLAKRFTRSQVAAIQLSHEAEEGRPIETIWDAVTGVTAFARDIAVQADRVAVEREAGRILDLVA